MAMPCLLKTIIPVGRHPNLAERELAILGDTHCNCLIASGQGSDPAACIKFLAPSRKQILNANNCAHRTTCDLTIFH
jgi:hypothetical protein